MIFLKWLASFLTGPIIGGMVDGYKAKLAAGNTSERIAADLTGRELAVEQREEELKAQILIVEQGHWFTRMVRPLWALPFIIWTWKVVVWDKVFADWTHGSTDALDGQIGILCTTVAGAYFIGRSAETITRILTKR
jgi:hypothetical protein